jgi:hypothetical protein
VSRLFMAWNSWHLLIWFYLIIQAIINPVQGHVKDEFLSSTPGPTFRGKKLQRPLLNRTIHFVQDGAPWWKMHFNCTG